MVLILHIFICNCITPIILFLRVNTCNEMLQNSNSNSNFIMIPQPLVPPQHFSNWTSRRSTNHYINMAPLSNKLVPLMTLIDKGIRKAAQKIFRKNGTRIEIYTAVQDISHPPFFTKIKNILLHKKESLNENIWCKFLYNYYTSQGVVIYIHNTHETKVEKKCSEDDEKSCDFLGWARDETLSRSVSNADLEHVYCCKVTSETMKKIFFKDFNIVHFLHIDFYFDLH